MVEMIIFLPFSKFDFSSAELNAGAMIFFTSLKFAIFSLSCLSSIFLSVTTMTLSNIGRSLILSFAEYASISLYAHQVIEFDFPLPALCCMR